MIAFSPAVVIVHDQRPERPAKPSRLFYGLAVAIAVLSATTTIVHPSTGTASEGITELASP